MMTRSAESSTSSSFSETLRGLLVLLVLFVLVSCTQQPAAENDAPAEAPDEVSATPPTETEHHEALPLPHRLAFMAGHVEAGLALYRAGEPEMAGTHLLHPVSETHAGEREGLDALGFDGSLFEAVSAALDAGLPATEIEPQLAAAEANLAMITQQASGDSKEIIGYLMDTVVEEYAIGVPETTVTDPGEYQDAFGFTKVAIARAASLEGAEADVLRSELEALLELWPSAPVPPESPTPRTEVESQVERVRSALAALG